MINLSSQSFREVVAWQKSHAFVLSVYRMTDSFPKHEIYGLTSQLRRAASSVPSNFVEGSRKRTTPDKLRFYNMAQASADECLYQLILPHDLKYSDTQQLQLDLEEVSRLLHGYAKGLERCSS